MCTKEDFTSWRILMLNSHCAFSHEVIIHHSLRRAFGWKQVNSITKRQFYYSQHIWMLKDVQTNFLGKFWISSRKSFWREHTSFQTIQYERVTNVFKRTSLNSAYKSGICAWFLIFAGGSEILQKLRFCFFILLLIFSGMLVAFTFDELLNF